MSDDKKQLLEMARRTRRRVRILRMDLLRLERLPPSAARDEWIDAKRRVLRESEVFLTCVESLREASE